MLFDAEAPPGRTSGPAVTFALTSCPGAPDRRPAQTLNPQLLRTRAWMAQDHLCSSEGKQELRLGCNLASSPPGLPGPSLLPAGLSCAHYPLPASQPRSTPLLSYWEGSGHTSRSHVMGDRAARAE